VFLYCNIPKVQPSREINKMKDNNIPLACILEGRNSQYTQIVKCTTILNCVGVLKELVYKKNREREQWGMVAELEQCLQPSFNMGIPLLLTIIKSILNIEQSPLFVQIDITLSSRCLSKSNIFCNGTYLMLNKHYCTIESRVNYSIIITITIFSMFMVYE
jgi:hypothetical protein